VITNGFYVWPKLIAAAFLLAALALVISPRWGEWRRNWRMGALLGALLALAMLAHGASIYGIIPLAFVAAFRGLPSWRWLGAAAVVGAVMIGSWSAYQKYDDPPGNRLVKWHLAGVTEIDKRGSLETIVDSYREAGLSGALENKWNNLKDITGIARFNEDVGDTLDAIEAGDASEAIVSIRLYRFFELLPVLGLLLIGPIAMAIRRRRRESEADWSFAVTSLIYVGIGLFFWALLQWGTPGYSSAIIHAGTLAIPVVAIAACVVGAAAVSTRLAIGLVAVNGLFVLVLYTPSLTPLAGTAFSPIAAILAATGLVGFAAVALGEVRWLPLRPRSGFSPGEAER
jgi:MFS family permease